MNVLILGGGKGSYEVRGRQLGNAIGAVVSSQPDKLSWADVVVLIKRANPEWAIEAKRWGAVVVWDALDFWQQPEQNSFSELGARALLRQTIVQYQPDLVIGATQAMATAAYGVYLPHHARPGLEPGPVRDVVNCVAYEGVGKYLGRWGQAAEKACKARGWKFVINPPDLRDADILLACRDGAHDGWMCREWKSGIKLVNAIASGRPVISQECAAWRELGPDGTLVGDIWDLDRAFDEWTDRKARAAVVRRSALRWQEWSLASVAAKYRDVLYRVRQGAAA